MEQGMCRRKSKFLAGFLFTVFLMVYSAEAGEEECLGKVASRMHVPCWYVAGKERIMCYECTGDSPDHFCSDPFNETHPDVERRLCKEYCAKWTRTTLSGKVYFQRSCSDQMHVTLRKSTVCIHESRPSSGQLCFCDQNYCNGAPVPRANCTSVILALVLLLVVNMHRSGLWRQLEIWR